MALRICLFFWLIATSESLTEPDPTCVCDPLCDPLDPQLCSALIPRPDCPCCSVCAGRKGAECDDNTRICDPNLGLKCRNGLCEVDEEAVLCSFENNTYAVHQQINSRDCELECRCTADAQVVCQATACRRGLFKKGSFSDDPLCEERPSSRADEQCCVLAVCAASDDEDEDNFDQNESNNEDSNEERNEDNNDKSSEDKEEDDAEVLDVDTSVDSAFLEETSDKFKVIEVLENDYGEDEDDDEIGQTKRTTPTIEPSTSSTTTSSTTTTTSSIASTTSSTSTTSSESSTTGSSPSSSSTGPSSASSNIEVLQQTSSSIQIEFPMINGGNLMYKPLSGHHPWSNALILAGNKIFTLTGLKPGTEYALKWRAPDKQYPQIRVATRGLNEKSPKAIVIGVSFDSATVSFDHFAPDDDQHGYVAMYMEVEEGHWRIFDPSKRSAASEASTSSEIISEIESTEAKEEEEDDLPTLRIKGLKPGTRYEARVAIYKDYESRSLGLMTNIVHFQTEQGCVYENRSRAVGTFALGCSELCTCHDSGHVECAPRCQPPLRRPGSALDAGLCVETFVDDDKCCVLVTCAGTDDDPDNDQGFSEDNGPCTGIQCGPNAACRHEVFRGEQAATLCVCEPGFIGDPDSSQGCRRSSNAISKSNNTDLCVVNENEVYAKNESWHEGCDYSCMCNENAEIVCQPRCTTLPQVLPPNCQLRADPDDPKCCQIMFCPVDDNNDDNDDDNDNLGQMESEEEAKILKPVHLDAFDGCVYKNASYKKDQRFYDGCEQQCQCMGYGDMVCLSRCPPTAFVAPGQNCYTLPDASDPCCNITVCDKPFLDPDQNVAKTTNEIKIDDHPNDNESNGERMLEKQARIIHKQDPASFQVETVPDVNIEGKYVTHFVLASDSASAGDIFALDDNYLVVKNFDMDASAANLEFVATTSTEDNANNNVDGDEDGDNEIGVTFVSQEERNVLLRLSSPLNTIKRLFVRSAEGEILASANFKHNEEKDENLEENLQENVDGCMFKGKVYAADSSFHDGCSAFCHCSLEHQVVCHSIRCPSKFGLDVVHPFCLEWDEHSSFVPEPPLCCPPAPVCVNDGSCLYEGQKFNNYDTLPMNLTGCEQRCYCEDGNVLCQDACYELSEQPPQYLACAAHRAVKRPQPDRPCCMRWGCPSVSSLLPSELVLISAKATNATIIRLSFELPAELDGLNGRFEVHHTVGQQGHPDPSQWPLAPLSSSSNVLTVSGEGEAVVFITSLLPNSQYFLKVDLTVEGEEESKTISSQIFTARTLPVEDTTSISTQLKSLDMDLSTSEVDSDSVLIKWRTFSAEEKKLIDGVQIRYVKLPSSTSAVPGTTPFIHRDTNFYRLEQLESDTEYEIDLYLIPLPDASTELLSKYPIKIRTMEEKRDIYDFEIKLRLEEVNANTMRVSWEGVPQPHQQFVHIYRLLFNDHQDTHSVFKVTKLDDLMSFDVNHLTPDTEYEVWLEAYLRNGKVFQSNVVKAMTTTSNEIGHQEMALPSSKLSSESTTSYFGAMLVSMIVAVLAILALLVLAALYLRRTTTYKAIISGGGAKRALNDNNNVSKGTTGRNGGQQASLSHVNEESVEMNGLRRSNA